MNIEFIRQEAKNILIDEQTGHDWDHALRVEKNAETICPSSFTEEDKNRVRVACWLHDLIDPKLEKPLTLEKVRKLLIQADATDEAIEDILHTIEFLSFSKNIEKRHSLSPVGEIVQDADRLDALGAIGIARTFYYGGSQGHKLYPSQSPRSEDESSGMHSRREKNVLDHFYEKLLRLEDLMNTSAGKIEAARRTRLMEEFLVEFRAEIGFSEDRTE